MYGVLNAVSPEVFPAKDRSTGNGLTATATRLFGVMVGPSENGLQVDLCSVAKLLTYLSSQLYFQAPVIAIYANLNTTLPVYVAGALLFCAGGLALLLPFEPRGKASI
jgi:hypothetical protein